MSDNPYAHIECREKLECICDDLESAGRIRTSARSDIMELLLPQMGLRDGQMISIKDGREAKLAIDDWLAARPHLAPATFTDDDEAAFGAHPSLAARGEYLRKYGREAYTEALHRWGGSQFDLRAGSRPADMLDGRTPTDDKAKLANTPGWRKNNPWSREAWNITEQGRLVKSIGAAKAAELARAVGSFIGATRPAA
jgi:hypothetical protein